jgi:translation initiation factor eIF-2B subunit alpha
MNAREKQSFYQLIREHSHTRGSSLAALRVLRAYKSALDRLRCAPADFAALFAETNDLIRGTEPRIVPLVHLIENLEAELAPYLAQPLGELKSRVAAGIDRQIALLEGQIDAVIRKGAALIADDDFIIAHSPSIEVRGIFAQAHDELQRRFRVLVVEQHFVRIRQIIETLTQAGIDHIIIPECNLSHYMTQARRLFLGAISVTSDRKVVTTEGSANIASLCHHHGIPIYLFACGLKFAHQAADQQAIPHQQRQCTQGGLCYQVTYHSHDMVDLGLVDHLITDRA